MFIDENAQQMCGNFCVIVHTDGTTEVKKLNNGEDVFSESTKIIGCRFLDHFMIQNLEHGVQLEALVNDEGYMEWQNDPTKVNQLATFLYCGGNKPYHYILGDVVFCLEGDGEEGGEFSGMSENIAERINKVNNILLEKAKEICPKPQNIPNPKVTISSYDSTEDLICAMRGDKTVVPSSVTVLGGEDVSKT